MNKEEVKEDVEKEICPICKLKHSLYLIEDGETWQSYKCTQCRIEVNVSYRIVLDNISIYNEKDEKEIEFEFDEMR